MNRLLDEQCLPLTDVPAALPSKAGKRLHIGTIYRWAYRGIAGNVLETVKIGGSLFTSREALDRFISGQTPGTSSDGAVTPSSGESIDRAERACDAAGVKNTNAA